MLSAIARLIAAVTLTTLIACGNPPPAGTVTSVTIDGGDRSIVLGDALMLTATVVVTGTASQAVTWSSSDDLALGIATDASGHVTITGYTFGAIEGSSTGGFNAFIRSYGR